MRAFQITGMRANRSQRGGRRHRLAGLFVGLLCMAGCSESSEPAFPNPLAPTAPAPAPAPAPVPDGPFTVEGRVREPGEGDLPGARIFDPRSGGSTESDSRGVFRLTGVTAGPLVVEKDGYERAEPVAGRGMVDVPMQRIVRVTAGDSITPKDLAPLDMDYIIGGEHCFPCKLIRVEVPHSGRLQLSVTWAPSTAPLSLWTAAQRLTEPSVELSVGGGDEVIYVGLRRPPVGREYTRFTLSTSFR
jgi:hypothetical protein